jgi:predicted DNA-binding transcriptional regulator YafY
MRADRLVAALLVLQARGQVTAEELARELEVSPRTARRDLEGLAMAGIPVYSQPGRGGGWRLLGGSRTDLSGLTAAEARTLFLVAGPSTATPEVKAALRKLVQALPSSFRSHAEAAASAVVLDPSNWDHGQSPPPVHLEALQHAVIDAVQVKLGYGRRDGARSARLVHPLGLVVKNQVWYLVAGTEAGQRTFRVSRVLSVERTDEPVRRPEGFDLAAEWRAIITSLDQQRAPATVRLRTDIETVDILRYMFGTRLKRSPVDADGRIEVEIRGASEVMVARQLAGLGGRFEVLAPPSVRLHLADIGRTLVEHHGTAPPGIGEAGMPGKAEVGAASARSDG